MSDVLSRLNNYITKGTDIKRLTEDLLVILKDVVIYNSGNIPSYMESLKEEDARELSQYLSNEQAIKMIDVLMNAIKDYKNVTSINPLFEITLIKLTSLDEPARPVIKETVKQVKVEETKVTEFKPAPQPVVTPKPEPISEPVKEEPKVEEEFQLEIQEPEPVKEEPAPVLTNIENVDRVIFLKDAEQEKNFKIDNNLMVNIMVSSKKDIKTELLDGWKNIKKLSTHPQLGKAATLLIDGRPLVASNKVVVLEYQLPKLAEKVNIKDMQADLQTVLKAIFIRQMFVYAVSRKESVEYQGLYMNLLQIGKLPKPADIVLEFEGE